jgi:hypothetical protein
MSHTFDFHLNHSWNLESPALANSALDELTPKPGKTLIGEAKWASKVISVWQDLEEAGEDMTVQ